MSRTVYVNGEFLPEENAKVSVFDRGFLFADAVYEVFPVLEGCIVDAEAHLTRLGRSLNEISLPDPYSPSEYVPLLKTLVRNNKLTEGLIYMQVSRGVADRSFDFPVDIDPTVVMFTQEASLYNNPKAEKGIKVVTLPDIRWQRCDIKTVALLPACLAKAEAARREADDAWQLDRDGNITEGSSNNVYIVTKDGKLVTRPLSNDILPGITRVSIMKLLEQTNLVLEERPFSVEEAENAQEAFYTSASAFVMPVVKINSTEINGGKPGPSAQQLRELCLAAAIESGKQCQAISKRRRVRGKSARA